MTIFQFLDPDGFEWDEAKNEANIAKHGISFPKATLVFRGPLQQFRDSRRDYGEIRYRVVGMMEGEEIAVIYTERGNILRIISARRAKRDERRDYRQVFLGQRARG